MPVPEEIGVWMSAPIEEALGFKRTLGDDALMTVANGCKKMRSLEALTLRAELFSGARRFKWLGGMRRGPVSRSRTASCQGSG